jgi:hypothetical protein
MDPTGEMEVQMSVIRGITGTGISHFLGSTEVASPTWYPSWRPTVERRSLSTRKTGNDNPHTPNDFAPQLCVSISVSDSRKKETKKVSHQSSVEITRSSVHH